MTFYVLGATVDDANLQAGDEIGIFDTDPITGEEICVGAGTLTQPLVSGEYLELIASMDDGTDPEQANGYTPGNSFIFRLYAQTAGLAEDVEYSFPYPGYDEVFTSQGNAFVELEGSITPGITFVPVWTTPYNPMTFYVTEALLDGIDLNVTAQIGIFDIDPNTSEEICVGAATLEEIISPENYLEIIASMDDGTVPGQANGFTPGNSFIFKFISELNLLIETVTFDFPYTGYDEVFTAQGNAIVDLSGVSPQPGQHVISLSSGWVGISSYLIPTNTAIEDVCSGISGQLQIIQDLNAFYQPGNSSNNLESWDYQSGYFIKVNDNAQLVINGSLPSNTSLTLFTGWNLFPVLSDQQVDIEILFAGQLDKVEIVKDAVGLKIYWPEKNISTLQTLMVGYSYLIKVTEDFTIAYSKGHSVK